MAQSLGVDIWFKLLSCEDPSWVSSYHARPNDPILRVPSRVRNVYPDWRPPGLVGTPLHPQLPGVCTQPFGAMVINWNGDVYPCCVVYGNAFKLGNLLTQELDDLWFGREYAKCRAFLRQYGPPQDSGSVCQRNPCPVIQKWID